MFRGTCQTLLVPNRHIGLGPQYLAFSSFHSAFTSGDYTKRPQFASRIERIKYRTVAPEGQQWSCSFWTLLPAIESNAKPASFFHDHVRDFLFQPEFDDQDQDPDEDELPTILSTCTGIRSLAMIIYPGSFIAPSLTGLRPHRLSLFLSPFIAGDLCCPTFTCVTHLEALEYRIPPAVFIQYWLPLLTRLPAVTHLSFRDGCMTTAEVLKLCTKLEVLICRHPYAFFRAKLSSVEDNRFVYMRSKTDPDVDDWLTGTKGGMDAWARAEEFIAKKRCGEIEPSSRCWIEEGETVLDRVNVYTCQPDN
ncbi:hypothetical protein B0H19DRAFT_1259020 [Mycena capillaripes]|nr:hypothetical protein B0H19DRAFT_1259020 [Mycena capillaripes]